MDFTGSMADDDLANIMYHSDIDTIASICTTRRAKVCNDLHFWEYIFKRDHLQFVVKQTTASGWIKEYKRVNQIMNIIDSDIDEGFVFDIELVKKMPLPINLKQMMGLYTNAAKHATFVNIIHKNDQYLIRYIYEDHVEHLIADFPVTKTDCYLILLYLFYYL